MRIPHVVVISELPQTTLPEGWHHYQSIDELEVALVEAPARILKPTLEILILEPGQIRDIEVVEGESAGPGAVPAASAPGRQAVRIISRTT